MNLLALSELKCRVTVWGAANLLKNLLNESCTVTPTYHLFFYFLFLFTEKIERKGYPPEKYSAGSIA